MADNTQGLSNLSDEVLQQLAKTPLAQPPPGIKPNFDDPPTRAAMQLWVTSVFLAITMLFYINRLYVKMALMKSWSWDDVTLLATVLLVIAQFVVMTIGVTQCFMGRHLWDISMLQTLEHPLAPVAYGITVLTPWTLLFLKTTFFLLYLHLFSRIRWARISSWAGILFVVISNSAVGIYTFVVTNPHESATWADKSTRLGVPLAILSLIADAIIFIVPFAAIIPLQISQAKRISALLIFMTGGSAIICSVLNIYYRHQLQNSLDTMWDSVLGSVCSLCEMVLGITCACLPTAAYGFRHKGSVYHKIFHPSQYVATKQGNSITYALTSRHGPGAADAESLNSRSRIRCTTRVEISTTESESAYGAKGMAPSIGDSCEVDHGDKYVELRTLELAHLQASYRENRDA